jgi:hypothetical protein
MVGASGFEPPASWSRTRRASFRKDFHLNTLLEKQELKRSSRMWLDVSGWARLPLRSLQKSLQSIRGLIEKFSNSNWPPMGGVFPTSKARCKMKRFIALILFFAVLAFVPSVHAQGQNFGGGGSVVVVSVPFSATPVFSYVSGSQETSFSMQLTGNVTSSSMGGSFIAGSDAQFLICQDGTGNRSFAFPASFLNTPSVGLTASSCTSGTWVYCGAAGFGAACPAGNWQNTDQGPVGTGAIPGPGLYYAAINCTGIPNCTVVHADGQVDTNATFTASSTSITTSGTAPSFCNGTTLPCTALQIAHGHTTDVGTVEFGTINCLAVNEAACTYNCPQGTISTVNSAHNVTVSVACTSNSSVTANSNNFIWGTDDASGLTTAFNAMDNNAKILPSALELPCGTLLMGTQSFIDAGVTTRQNTIGIRGCGPGNPTIIVPLPKMSCTGNANTGCLIHDAWAQDALGNVGMADKFQDILFWGGGIQDKDAAATYTSASGIYVSLFAELNNVWVEGWVWNRAAGTPEYGITCFGCTMIDSGSFAGGNFSCRLAGFNTAVAQMTGGSCGGSNFNSLTIGLSGATGSVETNGVYINQAQAGVFGTNTSYGVYNNSATQVWTDHGSSITTGLYNDTGGISRLYGSNVSGAGSDYDIYLNGGSLYASGITTSHNCNFVGGSFFDLGGNLQPFCPTGFATNTSAIYGGQNSVTGVALTVGKLVLSANWGTSSAVSAPKGSTSPISFTITNGTAATGASPTITYTFPVAYIQAPLWCTATDVGGTNAIGTFTTSSLTNTGVVFTFSRTPTANSTEFVQVVCPTQ